MDKTYWVWVPDEGLGLVDPSQHGVTLRLSHSRGQKWLGLAGLEQVTAPFVHLSMPDALPTFAGRMEGWVEGLIESRWRVWDVQPDQMSVGCDAYLLSELGVDLSELGAADGLHVRDCTAVYAL